MGGGLSRHDPRRELVLTVTSPSLLRPEFEEIFWEKGPSRIQEGARIKSGKDLFCPWIFNLTGTSNE